MLKLFLGENCLLLELATDMPETINSVSGGWLSVLNLAHVIPFQKAILWVSTLGIHKDMREITIEHTKTNSAVTLVFLCD